jgi:hypothetical protein
MVLRGFFHAELYPESSTDILEAITCLVFQVLFSLAPERFNSGPYSICIATLGIQSHFWIPLVSRKWVISQSSIPFCVSQPHMSPWKDTSDISTDQRHCYFYFEMKWIFEIRLVRNIQALSVDSWFNLRLSYSIDHIPAH